MYPFLWTFARLFRDVSNGAFSGVQLHDRIDALFEPSVGQQPTPELVASLQAEADALFRDILTGAGLVPNEWRVLVHVDDVLGPVPRIHGPNGQELQVAAFEQRLLEGTLVLPTA